MVSFKTARKGAAATDYRLDLLYVMVAPAELVFVPTFYKFGRKPASCQLFCAFCFGVTFDGFRTTAASVFARTRF